MVSGRMGHIPVFCSYAREDSSVRDRLRSELQPLRDTKVIDDWNDSEIRPGAHWDREIRTALDDSRLVIFIVTPDLLASEYVARVEIPRALELERAGKCHVVPIIARATEWGGSPLADFQALPGDARPITAFDDASRAWTEVTAGIHEVCKRIVDWENPYKRAQVGDWTHYEHTTHAQGQSVTAEGTAELIEKTATTARVKLEMLLNGQLQESTLSIDLTEPLEDRLGDVMKQIGNEIPRNAEVWIGPSRYSEDTLFIGGNRYECIKATRQFRLAARGEAIEGPVENWRCVDVPLDGIVKGTSDTAMMRQTQVLLGYGHGNAATAKPRLAGSPVGSSGAQPTAAGFAPGRWQIQLNAFGVGAEYDLVFHSNGALAGRQAVMGAIVEVQGQWGFDSGSGVLVVNVVTMMMGIPVGQEMARIALRPGAGGTLLGADETGRQYRFQRTG